MASYVSGALCSHTTMMITITNELLAPPLLRRAVPPGAVVMTWCYLILAALLWRHAAGSRCLSCCPLRAVTRHVQSQRASRRQYRPGAPTTATTFPSHSSPPSSR